LSDFIVMKFGGTSVADAERLKAVSRIVSDGSAGGVLVVLSALSKVTDALIACGRAAASGDGAAAAAGLGAILARHTAVAEILFGGSVPPSIVERLERARNEIGGLLRGAALLGEMPARSMDTLAGLGELLSSALLAEYMGSPWIDARSVIRTDSCFGSAEPDTAAIREFAENRVIPLLGPGKIAVTQGYIGSNAEGDSTTLGRGGSDYSASLFGAAIDAAEIQIWTDVEGVLTCDPRVVPGARPIESLGYDEAAELAAFGAKVLHPATIRPAVELGIPVTVRDSRVPAGRFTTISKVAASGRPVTALASRGPVSVLSVRSASMLGGSGFLARIFDAFGRREVSVDVVSTSEVCVSVTVDEGAPIDELVRDLSSFAEVSVERGRAVVAIVGERLRQTPGVAGTALNALRDIRIDMISLGANEINLSLVVPAGEAADALRSLHAAFFEGEVAS
jgi:aspartate kinase